jgi:predicted anti-sigma-YlaC factor YlaD
MDCTDAKLKVQALVDNELSEIEIDQVMDHVQSCYRCRGEYTELLKLQKKMKGLAYPEPPKEWFETLGKKPARKASSLLGQILFIGSYVLLFGYALYSLFTDSGEGLFIKLVFGGIVLGILFLLGVTVADRVRESKTDRYKGVMK